MSLSRAERQKELERAQKALNLWAGTCRNILVPVGKSASSVFRVRVKGITHFLRLTHQPFRSLEAAKDEMAFLAHMHACNVQVAMPIEFVYGQTVEEVDGHLAAIFKRARGVHVTPTSEYWNEPMFREWGKAIARQHEAACTFRNPSVGWRQDWRREPIMVEGLAQIRATDTELAKTTDNILAELETHATDLGKVGTIHADLGAQNFRYDPRFGATTFDFDNCCRHWLLYDLAVSKSTLRTTPNREQLAEWIIKGYQELRSLPGDPTLINLLLRARLLYVYCDRLYSFGASPDPEKPKTLRGFRDRLINGPVW